MSGLIDTNIFLYAANSDTEEHEKAFEFLAEAGSKPGQWYLSEGILYEFLRVSTHPRVFPKPLSWKEAMEFLHPVLNSPNFEILTCRERHWALLEKELRTLTHPSGNLFFDIRTVVLMKENGIGVIYTTDTDFLQFSSIRVVNPLRAQ